MSKSNDVTSKIENIFKKVAEKKNLINYKINFKLTEQSKDGFSSDMHFGSIADQDTGEEHFLILKKQFDYDLGTYENFLEKIFKNEIYFYNNVVSTFEKLQQDKNVTNQFHEVPKCFLTLPPPKAYLVLENLLVQGFKMLEMALSVPKKHLELIFKTYGKFHGISFAMKDQNPEDYEKLVRNFVDFGEGLAEWKLGNDFDKIYEELKISHAFTADKIDKYRNFNMREHDKLVYKGEYKCIVHGDCWSNNMMFKYSEDDLSKVHDIRLIDFQMCKEDTPIHDLSYFFYSGGVKEDFDHLDYYLKLYHDSFSASLSELGSDATKLFPFEKLKSEWVQHCKYGFFASTMALKVKFTTPEDLKEKFHKKTEINPDMFQSLKYDEEKYNKIMTDLIIHLCNIGGL